MSPNLFIASSDADIESCFPAFHALRPHLEPESFLARIRRQQQSSYQILGLAHDGVVKSVAGFRFAEFLAWGKVLYVDDLGTLPKHRGQGYAGMLLDWLIAHAQSADCNGLHLDSGYHRHAAHRLYLNKGLTLSSHHFVHTLGKEN